METEGEVSLLIDRKLLQHLPEETLSSLSVYSDHWKAFSVGDQPLGYTESGIVASISAPLSQCEANVLYMSTFRTDYCLVGATPHPRPFSF